MKHFIKYFIFASLLGCSDEKEDNLNTVGSSFVVNIAEGTQQFSQETYNQEALQILEKHRKNLKILLPEILSSEVEIYKSTIQEIQKVPVLTYTLKDFNKEVEKIHTEAGVTLIEKEIELNKIYFQLFNELSLLHLKYDSIKKSDFTDYYDAGPIVLSDEVMLKIDELVKDEDTRIALEKARNNKELAFSAITIIPGTSVCKGILGSITQAAKQFKNVEFISQQSIMVKLSHRLMNQKTASFISKTFKNDKIRSKVASVGYIGFAGKSTQFVAAKAPLYLSQDESNIIYIVIENKINGRIGDFSDGILAVHTQKIRDIIKTNGANIKQ